MPGSASSFSISLLGEAGDLLRIEIGERLAIGFALPQHDEPAQPGLGTFEREKLELLAVVVDRHAPLFVVVGGHQLAAARAPVATFYCFLRHRLGLDSMRRRLGFATFEDVEQMRIFIVGVGFVRFRFDASATRPSRLRESACRPRHRPAPRDVQPIGLRQRQPIDLRAADDERFRRRPPTRASASASSRLLHDFARRPPDSRSAA